MTDDEIDALHNSYRKARKAFSELDEKVDKAGQQIRFVAYAINANGFDGGNQARDPLSDRERENILGMPRPEELISLMDKWAEARGALRDAYLALPKEERKHVQSLPRNVGYVQDK